MAGRRKKLKLLGETSRDKRRVSKGKVKAQPELPKEVVELILSHLRMRDNIRASAVCKVWLAAASIRMINKPPLLMFFPKLGHLYEFYDPSNRKTYFLNLPELHASRVCYAKDGWLLLYKPTEHSLFFCCPYNRETIKLPNLELTDQTVAFSTAPTSPNCILFTAKHVNLMLVAVSTCRPGASAWKIGNYQNHRPFASSIWNKVVFCRGVFYSLSVTGWLGVYNLANSTWVVQALQPPSCPQDFFVNNWWKGKFMAEHKGDVFVVYTCSAIDPVIYKLDWRKKEWVEIVNFGGMSLFASFLSSHALLGVMRNNVYFSKVRFYGRRCVLYSLDTLRYYPRNQRLDYGEQDPYDSIWIEPPEDSSCFL